MKSERLDGWPSLPWRYMIVIAAFAASAPGVRAQTQGSTASVEAADPTVEESPLVREYDLLAQVLNIGNPPERREAARTLMLIRPGDVADAETRKMNARGFREVAFEDRFLVEEGGVGLVIWGQV